MDPLTVIVSAVAAGAAAAAKDVVAQVVTDGYAALKALIIHKFGQKAGVGDALEGVDKRPGSEARQAVLKEELEAAGADQDGEVIQKAGALLDLLKQHGVALGPSYHAELHGSGTIAQDRSVAAGEGGIAVAGDVEGGIHVGHQQRPSDAKKGEGTS